MTAFIRIGGTVLAASNIAGVEIYEAEGTATTATIHLKSPLGKLQRISLAPSQTTTLLPWLLDSANVLDLGLMTEEEHQAFVLQNDGFRPAVGGSKSRFGSGDIPGGKK